MTIPSRFWLLGALALAAVSAIYHGVALRRAPAVAEPAPLPARDQAAAAALVAAAPAPNPVAPRADSAAGADAGQERKARLLAEVVLRLKGTDLATDPETKAMVDRALAANFGRPEFVEIVAAFALRDHDADLLRIACAHPGESVGAVALRLVLANGGLDAVTKALQERDGAAIAQALGHANDRRALGLLAPLAADETRDLSLRQECVRALGHFEAGATALLALYRAKTLPAELHTLAAGVLAAAPWDAVRVEVQQLLPAPATVDAKLPPIHELVAQTGDAAHGEQVFAAFCSTCHRVAGQGVDYGPDLSSIGRKLGKDGLYQAILYPDAGVEFNFETTVLALRDGNSAIGIVVSDTAEEVAIKAIGGIVSRYRKADIVRQGRQKTSSMPAGLQSSLRQRDLIDLVEYLAALQK